MAPGAVEGVGPRTSSWQGSILGNLSYITQDRELDQVGPRRSRFAAKPRSTSLAVQARWVAKRLETHLLGEHLFANAKALVFAGLFFEESEAESWLELGLVVTRKRNPRTDSW